ncbi:ATP-NAD kinase-like domain-containing protein [Endogone sp. FLAS-F59071]|nr:ATP-NAD kinase-like domain-containing protein [Endogone sp. FLAS-F59071]|eukprot:RUS17217.1 ATP-NAD kinase-like domain-containing protein [Endogone sp. FLAS-F59071]
MAEESNQPQRIVFILNPVSAGGRGMRVWEQLEPIVEQTYSGCWRLSKTEYSGHAVVLAKELLGQGYTTIVAIGGDGTINQVVNGYMGAPEVERRKVAMGIIPVGTGGDFVRTVGINRDPVEALNTIIERNVKVVDVGKVIHDPLSHENATADSQYTKVHSIDSAQVSKTTTYFINICSIGLSAHVAKSVDSSPLTKRLASSLVYWVQSVSATLYAYTPKRVRFITDSTTIPATIVNLYFMAVCNAQYFGGGMRIGGDADPADGVLDLVILKDVGLWDAIGKVIGGLKDGTVVERLRDGKGERRKIERIIAEGDGLEGEECCVEVDGEFIGYLPVEIDIVKQAVNLIVP